MTKQELEAILLVMLLNASHDANPLAQAVANVALVKRTAQEIIDTSSKRTQALIDEIRMLAESQLSGVRA